ncbi:hypothetical protein BDY24DRAFT_344543 [Mrakia frigida]|uniref:uncharacterized protein n=1 Tax=Mrakia frigida TaxID=29902 RepID=UPI003FCBF420
MTSTLQTASNLLAKATTTEVAAALPKPPSWFAHLPSPVSKPAGLSIDELHAFLEKEKAGQLKGGVDWIVVDVRRTDIEAPNDYFIPSAVNLAAQTFYQTLPALYPMLSKIPLVIFHCSSSAGRGPRCAAWYQDLLDSKKETGSKALVLTGGIKAWAEKYGGEEGALVRL